MGLESRPHPKRSFVDGATEDAARDEAAPHVIPANAEIQEATSLADAHPFGSDDGAASRPKRRGEGTASRGSVRMRPTCHLVRGREVTSVRAPSQRLFAGRGAMRGLAIGRKNYGCSYLVAFDRRWCGCGVPVTLRGGGLRAARKSHVIPANAGIQEATSLAECHPLGSDDGLRLAPPHRGPWIPLVRLSDSHISRSPSGALGASASRPITRAPHPASPRKEAGRGDGKPRFSDKCARDAISSAAAKSRRSVPPLPAPLRGEVR
jgi:hypothetical protein